MRSPANGFGDAARYPPIQQIIERGELVNGHDQPEHDLVAQLGAFVAQPSLSEKRAGPAAGEFKQMQQVFRHAPIARLGTALVSGVEKIGQRRRGGVACRQSPRRDLGWETPAGDGGCDQQHAEKTEVEGLEPLAVVGMHGRSRKRHAVFVDAGANAWHRAERRASL